MTQNTTLFNNKEQQLFFVLAGIFITSAIVAEIIGAKIFSLEAFLGIAPAQISIIEGFKIDFNMSVGVLIWPVVFIISDIVNEYFGKTGVKRMTFVAIGLIIYTFFVLYAATGLPPAPFWLEVNSMTPQGNSFDINYAYKTVFSQGLNIIVASIVAFLLGQLVDAYAFHWFRVLTNNKKKWIRATGSTLISQLIDSFVILFLAFYVLGNWNFSQVIAVGIVQYTYKLIIAIAMTPIIYGSNYLISNYLGKEKTEMMLQNIMK
jgi:uncharacterized integral membrane protein (TIGR00697 family)